MLRYTQEHLKKTFKKVKGIEHFQNIKILGFWLLLIDGQCEVSDQIKDKRSDQMFKSEFKNDPTV